MLGTAPRSPAARGILDLQQRILRLERFEAWSNCTPLNLKVLVSPKLWDAYFGMQAEILQKMREAQKLAIEIVREVKAGAGECPGESE